MSVASLIIDLTVLFSSIFYVGGLGGIGMGLGPGGQPLNANRLSSGGGMASMGPGGQSALNFLSFLNFFYFLGGVGHKVCMCTSTSYLCQ